MGSTNVETYRAGHEAFNRREFDAMVREYAERIRALGVGSADALVLVERALRQNGSA